MPTNARMTWTNVTTQFPPGTAAFSHYVAKLGAMTSPNLPAGTVEYLFVDVPPGDQSSSLQTVGQNGTILHTETGPVVTVPSPVSVAVGGNIQVALVAA